MFKKLISIISAFIIILSSVNPAFANNNIKNAITDTSQVMQKNVPSPSVGSVGGEWLILGLARSGTASNKNIFNNYYKNLEEYVKSKNGNLHDKKYTEYSRVILAVTSIGKDARSVAEYDLTVPLGDFEKTTWQGINGSIFALIALDSKNYPMPKNTSAKKQATRDMYVKEILKNQLKDGGWSLDNKQSNADVTAMALQALSKYKSNPEVKKSIDRGLSLLSKIQNKNGTYSSYGDENAESTAQVLLALTELGISINDKRFKKNATIYDALLSFYVKNKGFKHVKSAEVNQMATEQAFYALVSVNRVINKKTSLYNMKDIK